jgi:hypothetical protein
MFRIGQCVRINEEIELPCHTGTIVRVGEMTNPWSDKFDVAVQLDYGGWPLGFRVDELEVME